MIRAASSITAEVTAVTVLLAIAPLAPTTEALVLSTRALKLLAWSAVRVKVSVSMARSLLPSWPLPTRARVVLVSRVVACEASPETTPPPPAVASARLSLVLAALTVVVAAWSLTFSPVLAVVVARVSAVETFAPRATMPSERPLASERWVLVPAASTVVAPPVVMVARSPMAAVVTPPPWASATVALRPTSRPPEAPVAWASALTPDPGRAWRAVTARLAAVSSAALPTLAVSVGCAVARATDAPAAPPALMLTPSASAADSALPPAAMLAAPSSLLREVAPRVALMVGVAFEVAAAPPAARPRPALAAMA